MPGRFFELVGRIQNRRDITGLVKNRAFIYKITGIPIAASVLYSFTGCLLNPMLAGATMAFSSVSVVCNSLRLKHKKMRKQIDAAGILEYP